MASLLQRFHDEASQIYGVPWANLRWRGFGILLDGFHQPPIRNIVNCSLRDNWKGAGAVKERGFDHHLMRFRPPPRSMLSKYPLTSMSSTQSYRQHLGTERHCCG